MVTYDEAAIRLRKRSDLDCGAGATEEQIANAEEKIGAFPPQYRRFLADFGWADFGPFEVWGLGPRSLDPSYDVVRETLFERELGGLPAEAIAIYNNGGGDLACFLAGAAGQTQEAVYYFWHDNRSLERGHDSFADFLWYLLDAADAFDARTAADGDEDGDARGVLPDSPAIASTDVGGGWGPRSEEAGTVTYEETANRLRKRGDLDCGAGASEQQIAVAAAEVGAFPSQYRRFLRDFGWALFAGSDVWGVGPFSFNTAFDVAHQTRSERERGVLPDDAIAIYDDGAGSLAVFQTDGTAATSEAVYFFRRDDRSMQRRYDSFADFLWDLLDRADEADEGGG